MKNRGNRGRVSTDKEETNEFERFWAAYPRKVGKFAAEKAFRKARKDTPLSAIMAGLVAYRVEKPAYADWCHPATFLRQGRWLDEYDAPHVEKKGASDIGMMRAWAKKREGL